MGDTFDETLPDGTPASSVGLPDWMRASAAGPRSSTLDITRAAGVIPGAQQGSAQQNPYSGAQNRSGGVFGNDTLGMIAKAGMLGMAGGAGGSMLGAIPAAALAFLMALQGQKGKDTRAMKKNMDLHVARDSASGSGGTSEGGDFAKGGKVAQKKPDKKAAGGVVSNKLNARKPKPPKVTAKPVSSPRIPSAPVTPDRDLYRNGLGQFAKGGLVRGMGAAVRGKTYKGEC